MVAAGVPAALATVPFGYLDVTTFGADPQGVEDSTAALQQAIEHGMSSGLVVWLPGGTYRVSARIEVNQPDNGDAPAVIMGSTVDPANRAVIYLAPNSPGFGNPEARRVVLHYYNVGTADDESANTNLYNQALVGVDFRIGAGNDGAVAVRMQGAEGCTIQDVHVDLTAGGHTGFWGIPGSGGSTHGVSVTGGVIGLDTRSQSLSSAGTQPQPVITGSSFINQTQYAVYCAVRGSLVMVGCRIEREAEGPTIALTRHWEGQPFDSSLQLIDSTLAYATFSRTNTVLEMVGSLGRSFYFDNVYVRNARRIWPGFNSSNDGWTQFRRAALQILPAARDWGQPEEPVYVEGAEAGASLVESAPVAAPPADLQARHQWQPNFPTWESAGVVNVKALGALGDGQTDDWAALQAAIDAHEVVFFPKGHYRVSRTLELRPESKLIGSHHQFTSIEALSSLEARFAGTTVEGGDAPIVRTADTADAQTYLAFMQIKRHFPLAAHDPTPPGNYALEWRSGGDSIVRMVKLESRPSNNIRPDLVAERYYQLTNAINPFHPQADFPEGMWGWPCAEPNVQIRGNGGGRWFNFWFHGRQGLRENVPFLRVENTTQPLHFYHLHLQQQDSRNHAEIRDAANVSIYGTKGEIKGTLVYFENCNNVRLFGNGGLTSPDPDVNPPYLFRFINCRNFQISGIGDTINEGDDRWIGGPFDRWIHANVQRFHPIQDQAEGRPEVRVPHNQRPILYLRGNPSAAPQGNNASIRPPWLEVEAFGDGIYALPWFGYFSLLENAAIFHYEHGFLYTPSSDTANLWLYDPKLGWLWTAATDTYPYLYSLNSANWLLYLRGGNPGSRYFFDFQPGVFDWIQVL